MKALNKRLPQRTCVACRRVGDKPGLVRLVRLPDGSVTVDAGGKQAGRGAYLCRTPECWQAGLKDGRLEHALRVSLSAGNRAQLVQYGQELREEAA
ncbi:MAG: YlxR family protein [Chloroflexota bacterium]